MTNQVVSVFVVVGLLVGVVLAITTLFRNRTGGLCLKIFGVDEALVNSTSKVLEDIIRRTGSSWSGPDQCSQADYGLDCSMVRIDITKLLPDTIDALNRYREPVGVVVWVKQVPAIDDSQDDRSACELHKVRSQVWFDMHEFTRAIDEMSAAIEHTPGDPDCYNSRGYMWSKLGDWESAIAEYDTALKIDPQFALALVNRGNAYRSLGEVAKAESDLARAIELGYEDQGRAT